MYEIDHYFSQFKIELQNKLADNNDNKTNNLNNTNDDILKKKYLNKIKFINIKVNYDNKNIFNNLNLEIIKNNKVVLVGPIGSGKSTILKVLAGIVKYDGLILIDGNDISKDPNFISTNISYVSQHPKLFNKSIYHNIVYGTQFANNNPNSRKLVIQKLEQFGVMDFINSFPNGLDTIVGKEGNKLSGGQKHMVALIRTLIQDRPIILLDEPTSSLDTKNKRTIIDIIRNINNKTLIVTTHDTELLKIFQHKVNVNNL
jgi:ABC-type bacteriocin/lantibiotic exporter with double-glycine peptidase domain